jgi:hypothetical protein
MPQPRVSTSFADREVNVLAAMIEAAQTGVFTNPEDTATFQHTARKVVRLRKRFKAMPK